MSEYTVILSKQAQSFVGLPLKDGPGGKQIGTAVRERDCGDGRIEVTFELDEGHGIDPDGAPVSMGVALEDRCSLPT